MLLTRPFTQIIDNSLIKTIHISFAEMACLSLIIIFQLKIMRIFQFNDIYYFLNTFLHIGAHIKSLIVTSHTQNFLKKFSTLNFKNFI